MVRIRESWVLHTSHSDMSSGNSSNCRIDPTRQKARTAPVARAGWSSETNEVLDLHAAGHTSKVYEQRAPGGNGRVVDPGMSSDEDDGVGFSDGVVEWHVFEPEHR